MNTGAVEAGQPLVNLSARIGCVPGGMVSVRSMRPALLLRDRPRRHPCDSGRMITARARRPPAGTVTFLFTDVEGSTKLLHELGAEAYAEALAEHRRVIREACAAEAGSRSTRRATPSSSPSPPRRARSRRPRRFTEALASGPIQVRVGLHTGTPLLDRRGLRRRRRPPRRPHRRGRVRRAGARLVLDGAARRARARETSASTGSRTSLLPSASTSSETADFPALKVALPHEPARASDTLPRTRAGARRGRRAPRCRRRAPPHPDRAGWHGEDATRAAGGWSGLRRLPRRRVVGPARAAARPGARPRDRGADARLQERPRRAHRRQGDALPLRQLRAGGGGSARARGARERLSQPRCARHEPRASAGRRRADLPRAPARREATERRSS